MKLNIDTENKTITINESVNLKELNDTIKKLLPNDWKEYNLVIEQFFNVPYQPLDINKTYPWINPNDKTNPYDGIQYPWSTITYYSNNSLTQQSLKDSLNKKE